MHAPKNIVILGAGESGTGAALLAHAKGWRVFVSDAGKIATPYKKTLLAQGIALEEGQHSQDRVLTAQVVIKSPGIPPDAPIIQVIQQAKIPIIDEVEFAARYTNAFLIAITGTNGKTTTTHLTYHLLKAAGLKVGMAGNMGISLASKLLEKPHDYYVLELSSFQLEGIAHFKADIACLLNISPAHLDRYNHQMASYTRTKFRLLQNMQEKGHFIYCQEDAPIQHYLQKNRIIPVQHPVSLVGPTTQGAYQQDGYLHFACTANSFKIPLASLQWTGTHNRANAMIAISVASLVGVSPAIIKAALPQFKGLPHRMEWVAAIRGISIYNDSKATNVAAAYAGLASFEQPIIWIAGGQDKGNDYAPLKALAKTRVKALICVGKDNTPLQQAFQQVIAPIYATQQLEEAVAIALAVAKRDEVIVFAPACASFDLFNNFAERGEQFKKVVWQAIKNESL